MKLIGSFLLLAALAAAADQGAPRGPLDLSLKRAVDLAISPEGSARIQIAGESLRQAQSRSAEARASLLPDVEASFNDQSRTENLAALGLGSLTSLSLPIPGFSIPALRGSLHHHRCTRHGHADGLRFQLHPALSGVQSRGVRGPHGLR